MPGQFWKTGRGSGRGLEGSCLPFCLLRKWEGFFLSGSNDFLKNFLDGQRSHQEQRAFYQKHMLPRPRGGRPREMPFPREALPQARAPGSCCPPPPRRPGYRLWGCFVLVLLRTPPRTAGPGGRQDRLLGIQRQGLPWFFLQTRCVWHSNSESDRS